MNSQLTTKRIAACFQQAVQKRDGQVKEVFDDTSTLFCRSLLPYVDEVKPKDKMQGGLALRASEDEICLYPFLFRQICRNGAIMSQVVDSWTLRLDVYSQEAEVIQEMEEAIVLCSRKVVFSGALGAIKASVDVELSEVNTMLMLAPLLASVNDSATRRQVVDIFTNFNSGKRRTRFALMNVVTATARDLNDQPQRWRLEELGGAIGAGLVPVSPQRGPGVAGTIWQPYSLV